VKPEREFRRKPSGEPAAVCGACEPSSAEGKRFKAVQAMCVECLRRLPVAAFAGGRGVCLQCEARLEQDRASREAAAVETAQRLVEPAGRVRRCEECGELRPTDTFAPPGVQSRICPGCRSAGRRTAPRHAVPQPRGRLSEAELASIDSEWQRQQQAAALSWRSRPVVTIERWCCTDRGDGSHDSGCVFAARKVG
jgi:hypothetical protein